jgi:tetratricopeptide (TPR) repeat protein
MGRKHSKSPRLGGDHRKSGAASISAKSKTSGTLTTGKGIPTELLMELRDDLAHRRIASGIARLAKHEDVVAACRPGTANAAALLGYLAQWIDIGYPDGLLRQVLPHFREAERDDFTLLEYVHVKMAEGLAEMREESYERAIKHFEAVVALQDEIRDKQVVAIAFYWLGRCLRRNARYADALGFVAKGRAIALELKYPKMAAVMQVLEAWIAFQDGKPDEAARILRDAGDTLSDTDDHITLGNIASAYGRIARRQGNHDLALSKFETAIREYEKRDPFNRNLARSFVNIAFVKRLLALQWRNRIDSAAARERRKRPKRGESKPLARGQSGGQDREVLARLRAESFDHLKKARAIYDRYDDHRGNGNVFVTLAYLHLDNGELDLAATMGRTAYRLGDEKKDSLLKGRARMLQSAIEFAKFEEQIEEQIADGSGGVPSSELACEFAREALECAKRTQNRRLTAKSYIALGLALSLDAADDHEGARECATFAADLLKQADHDYVWRELQELNRRLRGGGNINAALRDWSRGIIGAKTFQEVSDDFASVVIPKVWRREGCKVARVAARLSISPKKVRRILRAQGLLAEGE